MNFHASTIEAEEHVEITQLVTKTVSMWGCRQLRQEYSVVIDLSSETSKEVTLTPLSPSKWRDSVVKWPHPSLDSWGERVWKFSMQPRLEYPRFGLHDSLMSCFKPISQYITRTSTRTSSGEISHGGVTAPLPVKAGDKQITVTKKQ
ncbi:hypothetical protein J6590_018490 [Homalodisca vitripennis]|nr:hypothetical protein J6590_018490 [Homalodisca vitripennis]